MSEQCNRESSERKGSVWPQSSDTLNGRATPRHTHNFAFVVFRYPEDAKEAVRDRNGRKVCGRIVRVEHARRAGRRPMRGNFDYGRNFKSSYHRRLPHSSDRYEHRSRSSSPIKSKRSPSSPNSYKDSKPKESPRKKSVKHSRSSQSPDTILKKSSKSRWDSSVSNSPSPQRSRLAKKHATRSESSSSAASSVSPKANKKQKKRKTQSHDSSDLQTSDEHDVQRHQKKQGGSCKIKPSEPNKKSNHLDINVYSSHSD
ncbi:serine/arginine-rich splicing factor 7-like isoform x1 [Plakobranchus ocellatus]|uniref:Serine/arginine-rich splicing factor 7-like isoform x1 n=1 Tax=Plakobranchus ocellatus TaxID=259542 RepID=A0AAV3ZZK3_9GAST|nr:serine/arginine-rich splicing factor 7-like isoform x1 [Plakobranchus ocellatus]